MGLTCTASAAYGHITVGKRGSTWYVDGATLPDDPNSTKVIDPLSLIFFRSAGTAVSRASIDNAFAQHWTGPRDMSSTAACNSRSGPQRLRFRAFKRYNGRDAVSTPLLDFQELNGSIYATFARANCSSEYHVRWWTDEVHASIAQGSDPHGASGQWVVGDPHYEIRTRFGSHKPAKQWSDVRDLFIRYMRYYCGNRHFKYNAASYGPFQGKSHDGWMGALSLTPRASGC